MWKRGSNWQPLAPIKMLLHVTSMLLISIHAFVMLTWPVVPRKIKKINTHENHKCFFFFLIFPSLPSSPPFSKRLEERTGEFWGEGRKKLLLLLCESNANDESPQLPVGVNGCFLVGPFGFFFYQARSIAFVLIDKRKDRERREG